jgi:hypothetical protein
MVTFTADLVGITMAQVESVPVIKKTDVEQMTLRDEIFSSLSGPVMSRDQIEVSITMDERGELLRVEGVIDRILNAEQQAATIRRLADFLNGNGVFSKSLVPFITLGKDGTERSATDAARRILVREARINDVPVKSLGPGSTPRPSSMKGPMSTPVWDPEYEAPLPDLGSKESVKRHELRRASYQTSIGVSYSGSTLAIPTPHNGRWDRTYTDPPSGVKPELVEPLRLSAAEASPAELTSARSSVLTPHAQERRQFYQTPNYGEPNFHRPLYLGVPSTVAAASEAPAAPGRIQKKSYRTRQYLME